MTQSSPQLSFRDYLQHYYQIGFNLYLNFQQINARAEVLRMERELEEARKKLTIVNQRRYQTDSEQSEQSG